MADEQHEWNDDSEESERIEDREREGRSHQMKLAHPSEYSHQWGR
jgi:hypothetical protein